MRLRYTNWEKSSCQKLKTATACCRNTALPLTKRTADDKMNLLILVIWYEK